MSKVIYFGFINKEKEIVTLKTTTNLICENWLLEKFSDYGTILLAESREMIIEDFELLGLDIEDCKK